MLSLCAVIEQQFHVGSTASEARPPSASIAVNFRGYWFYGGDADQDTKATFSLLLESSRLELAGKPVGGLLITLPVTGNCRRTRWAVTWSCAPNARDGVFRGEHSGVPEQ